MENIKNSLDFCAAGLHYKSAANRKDLAELLLQTASENTINTHHPRYPHFCQCIKQCETIAKQPLAAATYHDTLKNIVDTWDILGDWTWTYRVLLDVCEMDKKICGL